MVNGFFGECGHGRFSWILIIILVLFLFNGFGDDYSA